MGMAITSEPTEEQRSELRPFPNCRNCGGTGWVTYTNKRKEIFGQPCYICELSWKIEESDGQADLR